MSRRALREQQPSGQTETRDFRSQTKDVLATSLHLLPEATMLPPAFHALFDPAAFGTSRKADVSNAVCLADGVYLPWVKFTSEKSARSWANFTLAPELFDQLEFVHHRLHWDAAGIESTVREARTHADPASADQEHSGVPTTDALGRRIHGGQRAPGLSRSARHRHPQSLPTLASGSLCLELCQAASGKWKDNFRERGGEYSIGDRFGVGRSTGHVSQAQRGGQDYAVKRARFEHYATKKATCEQICAAAIREVYLLERCAQHPNIVNLCDVYAPPDGLGLALVMECWGTDLDAFLPSVPWSGALATDEDPSGFAGNFIRDIASQVLEALKFLHTELHVIHGDVKPSNCLVKRTDDGMVHLKLCDLNSAMASDPARRPVVPKSVCSFEMLNEEMTLPYRSPEITWGDIYFSDKIDLWSVGVIMAMLAGDFFTSETPSAPAQVQELEKRVALTQLWFQTLGSPTSQDCEALQHFQGFPSMHVQISKPGRPWRPATRRRLGKWGVFLLQGLLSYRADKRPTAAVALASSYFAPDGLFLVQVDEGGDMLESRQSVYSGIRHPWNLLEGYLAPEILEMFCNDEAFKEGSPQFGLMRGCLEQIPESKETKNSKAGKSRNPTSKGLRVDCELLVEGGAEKYRLAGRLTPNALDGQVNNMCTKQFFPLESLRRWRCALLRHNEACLVPWEAALRSEMRALDADLSEVEKWLGKGYETWLWAVGEMHILKRCEREPFKEALHNDGSASAVHIGLALAGNRSVRFLQEKVSSVTKKCVTPSIAPDVKLECTPGHIYMGPVTGARHQVEYPVWDPSDDMHLPVVGSCGVVVVIRSCVWPGMARCLGQTPSPKNAWNVFSKCVRNLMSSNELVMPSLQQCLDEVLVDA